MIDTAQRDMHAARRSGVVRVGRLGVSVGVIGAAILAAMFAVQPPTDTGSISAIPPIAPVARIEMAKVESSEAAPMPVGAEAVKPVAASGVDEARQLVENWARAWSERDVEKYLSFYGKEFVDDQGISRSAWERVRRQRIQARRSISVTVRDLNVELAGENLLKARFVQDFSADAFRESGVAKVLTLSRDDSGWRIVAEAIDRKKGAGGS